MKKIIFGLFASFTFAFAFFGFNFDDVTCDSFDVKINLMDEELMLSEIVTLYTEGSVIINVAGRPGFRITENGYVAEYSTSMSGSRHTYTNMKKESEKNGVIFCSMIHKSEYWERDENSEQKPEVKKVFYTISQDEDKGERLIVKVKE